MQFQNSPPPEETGEGTVGFSSASSGCAGPDGGDVNFVCIFPRWGEVSLRTLTLAACPLESAQRKTGENARVLPGPDVEI